MGSTASSILPRVAGRATVWLVGMMGAGKSTVGPLLAERLGRAFVDTDAEIEREGGLSVAEIFEREGEASFRARERAVIDTLRGREAVVALGGGAVAQPGMLGRLAQHGVLVYLRATPATLLARLGDCEERPLLAGLSESERASQLAARLDERRGAYEACDLSVDCDDRPLGELVDAISERLRELWEAGPA